MKIEVIRILEELKSNKRETYSNESQTALSTAIETLKRIDEEKIAEIINDNCRYIVDEGKVMFIYGNTAQAIVNYLRGNQ